MKRDELNCPKCHVRLNDLKSSLKCESCQKHYQVKISKQGVKQFLLLFAPSCFLVSAMVVLNWKLEGFLDIPNRDIAIYGAIGLGALGIIFSTLKMKSEFEVGKEISAT